MPATPVRAGRSERAPTIMPDVTTSPVEAARPRGWVAGMGLGGSLALTELVLTISELLLVSGPALALTGRALWASGEAGRVLPLVAAALVASWVRAADSLRPVIAARAAKQRGQALGRAEVEAA